MKGWSVYKLFIFIPALAYCLYFSAGHILALGGEESIATVSSEATKSSDLSASPSGILETIRHLDAVFPREEAQILQKPTSEPKSWPTIDTSFVRTSVPPSIAARRRLKNPQLGLRISAPDKLAFPDKEVSSKEQWAETGNIYNGKENTITIVDE